jgi:hypothetical protein
VACKALAGPISALLYIPLKRGKSSMRQRWFVSFFVAFVNGRLRRHLDLRRVA